MSDARSRALSELLRFQVTESTVGETLQQVAGVALDAVPAATVCGLTMLDDDGRPTTAIYTDALSPQVDEAQYRAGRGPCLDAWRLKKLVLVDDAENNDEYPEHCAAALAHGIRSTISFPLVSAGTGVGAMNLYAPSAMCFTQADQELGMEVAAAASTVIANVAAYRTAFDLNQQLNEAMRSRAVIEQAKGMLMGRSSGLSAEEAFEILRKASQRENVKLREIAERIVKRRSSTERCS